MQLSITVERSDYDLTCPMCDHLFQTPPTEEECPGCGYLVTIKVPFRGNFCPYCGVKLDPKPKRKKKCPDCGRNIFVRKGVLLTEADAALNEFADRLGGQGISLSDLEEERGALRERFGKDPSANDVAWSLLNALANETDDLFDAKIARLEMARILRIEGRDPKTMLEEASKDELKELMQRGYRNVKTNHCNDSSVCNACRETAARSSIPIEEALQDLPVPRNCTGQHGCRCSYRPADPMELLKNLGA